MCYNGGAFEKGVGVLKKLMVYALCSAVSCVAFAAVRPTSTGDGEKATIQEGDSCDIPLAPPKYRRPPNYKLETYPKSLKQLSAEYSQRWMARAKTEMARIDRVNAAGPYHATGESLDRHTCPEWFMDFKLGVQVDWNLSSIASWSPYRLKSAMYPDWYELRGYREDWPTNSPFYGWYEYHKKNWGADFRRDHFINLFKAEKFDADALCKTLRACGIRYVLPFMKHHGGFCHWDSSWTFRNTVEMCPHRNFAAEYRAACDKYGLKFGFYFSNGEWEYPMLRDDGTIEMYKETNRREPWTPEMEKVASGKVAVHDYNRDYSIPQAVEFIDKYKPDFLYYDYDWMQYADQLGVYDISAYFYNVNHGKKDVAINDRYGWGRPKDMAGRIPKGKKPSYKSQRCVRGDYYTDEFGDNSKSLDPANYHPFICCRGISSAYGNHWQDTEKTVLSHRELIVLFTSLVARGGNLELMLNLDAQGDIPALQLDRLEALGKWLERWGEAIYFTRVVAPYSTPEVDYTRTKDGKIVYAIVKNPSASVCLKCRVPRDAHISVLGDDQAKVSVDGAATESVRVTLPAAYAQSDLPIVLKVVANFADKK